MGGRAEVGLGKQCCDLNEIQGPEYDGHLFRELGTYHDFTFCKKHFLTI